MTLAPALRHFKDKGAAVTTLYCDGACSNSDDVPRAGYGVYSESDVIRVHVCEPLEGSLQTAQRAEVRAMLSALEVVWALRVRNVEIVSDSEYVVKGYNDWMQMWKRQGWRRMEGEAVAHRDLWEDIADFPREFEERGMKVEVVWKPRNSMHGQRVVDELAKAGCLLNVFCESCRRYIGRGKHECEPFCGMCEERRFCNEKALEQHYDTCHEGDTPCRRGDCSRVLGSCQSRGSHERMVHKNRIYACEDCGDAFKEEEVLDKHFKEGCEESKECGTCGKRFRSMRARDQHREDVHGY